MDNHQYYNANGFEDVGGGWVMAQDGFTPASLSARLEAFLTSPATLEKAAENAKKLGSPDAAEKLARLVLETVVSGQLPVASDKKTLTDNWPLATGHSEKVA
jgi:UDP-N-acetylglucosamine--N-acetylmuramyl-(pentapeptide) pyrophosphoryl-undecaprenol N-acetylglucosamine transferase